MPKVSVIVPVYNVEKYLPKCLDCLINQTLKDIEIICINDCSTDSSLAILKDYASKDKRIKLIDLPLNNGAGNARNKGLEAAKGEYIGFVDPDDYIDLNFYEELYKNAIKTNADIVKTEIVNIGTDGVAKNSQLNNKIKLSKFYFSYEYVSAIYKSSLIFDNNILFPPELIVGEDTVFLHKLIIKAKKIELINSTKYYYVKRQNSLFTDLYDEKRMKSAIKSIEYRAENYNNSYLIDITDNEYLIQYYGNMLSLIGFTISKTNESQFKIKCIEKFINLFYKCKTPDKLEILFRNKNSKFMDLIKNNDIKQILNICQNFKSFDNYCILSNIRQKVARDMKNV